MQTSNELSVFINYLKVLTLAHIENEDLKTKQY